MLKENEFRPFIPTSMGLASLRTSLRWGRAGRRLVQRSGDLWKSSALVVPRARYQNIPLDFDGRYSVVTGAKPAQLESN